MTIQQERTLSLLTGPVSTDSSHGRHLQDVAERYPYFAPAQLMLAVQIRSQRDVHATAAAAKAVLYVPNIPWLQYQLQGTEEPVITQRTTAPQPAATAEDFTAFMQGIRPLRSDAATTAAEDADETDAETMETLPQEGSAKIADLLSQQLADFKKPVDADAQLEIDKEKIRLYTIDYFASQGIKLDINTPADDKFTHQLRKFTDWLKHMKPETAPADTEMSADLENAVIMIAQKSNQSREVVTETMAEVLAKQGQTEKAIQLYVKLSFINPEKSAYFAAKIQQLKGI